MGDINSKDYADYLQDSAILRNVIPANASSKNNIVLVNPEIHLQRSADSTNNDERLKKLQVEIDNERNLREFEKHRRHAEKLVNENLLREKDQQIEDQNKILNWHVGILTEQQARLNEAYQSREERNRMGNGAVGRPAAYQQTNKWQKRRRKNHQKYDKFSHNNSYNTITAPYNHGRRIRSRTEVNFENDPMELWQWSGKKWVHLKTNTPNGKEASRESCDQEISDQKNNTSRVQSQTPAPLTSSTMRDAALEQTTKTLTYCSTTKTRQQSHASGPTGPNNISISFDEHELPNLKPNDFNIEIHLRPKAP